MTIALAKSLGRDLTKAVVAGGIAAACDKFVMGNEDIKGNAMFGGAVAGGIWISSSVESIVSPMFPTATFVGAAGKALEGRIVQIACGYGASKALEYFLLHKTDFNTKEMMMKVGIITGADIGAEVIVDMLGVII